jgi:hypothetical protein
MIKERIYGFLTRDKEQWKLKKIPIYQKLHGVDPIINTIILLVPWERP